MSELKFKIGDRVKFLKDKEVPETFKQNTDAICIITDISEGKNPYRIEATDNNIPIFETPLMNIHCINAAEHALIQAEGTWDILEMHKEDLRGSKPFELRYRHAPPNNHMTTCTHVTLNEIANLGEVCKEFVIKQKHKELTGK